MPAEFAGYGERWRELHPDWQVIDWQDLGDLPFHNKALWDNAPAKDRHRWRADIARLEIVFQMGGVYVDCDLEPLKAIDPLLEGITCGLVISANRGAGGVKVVSNAVIMAEPGHRFLRDAIRLMPVSVQRYGHQPTARAVGPWHLQRVLDGGNYPDVTLLPERTFYPQSNAQRDRGETPNLEGCYGWHRWATSR